MWLALPPPQGLSASFWSSGCIQGHSWDAEGSWRHESQCSEMPTCPPPHTLHSQASLEEDVRISRSLCFLRNSGHSAHG